MSWIKALHVIFMVTWFAGLFYLPRLFVYHALSTDATSLERFKIMEHKLFWGIMTPGAIATTVLGIWMLGLNWTYYVGTGWMRTKLLLLIFLFIYHIWCGKLLTDFKHGRNIHSHVWYRWFNEIPVLFLIAIVILVIVRPF
jgi:protoporphyrinogen IX oxidase